MVETTGRRRVVRLAISWQLHTKASFQRAQVRLLDLSFLGARIAHAAPVEVGIACFVDLPPALGEAHLVCRVVWTKSDPRERGDIPSSYQSGLAFVGVTPAQQRALLAALESLKTQVGQCADEDRARSTRERGLSTGSPKFLVWAFCNRF